MAISLKPIDQQVIVITGASSGIGLATAQAAATRGAKLVLTARSGHTLAAITDTFRDLGCEAIHVVADVSDRSQLEAVASAAAARFGRIDTWVNNAGLTIFGRLDEVTDPDNRRLFDINFWGVVYGSLAAVPYLAKQGGALINLGSELSEAAVPLQGMYTASKHAVKGFTDALRIEVEQVQKLPVAVTLIEPTAVNTPFPQHARNYMPREPKLPEPQIDPDDVADAILGAASSATRSDRVGAMATLNAAMSRFLPALADRMAAMRVEQQQSAEPPQHPEGALYRGMGEGLVRGCRKER